MNSFKKIALAVVAAMTLGTLVVTPASANTVSLAVTTAVSGSGTAASPYTVKVPSDNVVSVAETSTVTNNEALLITATVVSGTPVTFTAVGANTRLVSAIGSTVNAAAGSSSITVTPASTTASVYAYTTSTGASAVTVSVVGASTTIYLKGVAGPAYDLKMTIPSTGNISGKVTATLEVADIFGNAVADTVTVTTLGGATAGSVTADALITGKYTSEITLPATAGTVAVGASIATPTSVPTLKLATTSQTAIVTVADIASSLASVNAALAAERAGRAADAVAAAAALKAEQDKAAAAALTAAAELAKVKAEAVNAKIASDAELAKVKADNAAAIAAMKKAFNDLAKKWNAKNPKAKVTLVK